MQAGKWGSRNDEWMSNANSPDMHISLAMTN